VNIIIFGPPGAGKGTQSDNLVKDFNLIKVSTGDLLRDEIKKGSLLGKNIEKIIDKGKFVPDKIINDLIEIILSKKDYLNRLIFDGFPRNLNQVKSFEYLLKTYNQKISCVFTLNVDKKNILKRILGRQICSQCGLIFNIYFKPANKTNHNCDSKYLIRRSDDNEKTIADRYATYVKETFPILKYYQKQNLLHEINGMNEIERIYKEICSIMGSLETWLYKMYLYK